MMGMKSKGLLGGALLSILTIRMMYSKYSGVIVARLPFEPVFMVANMTHYGLEGDDLRDCSMTFLYVLANLTVGNYTKKLL